MADILNSGRNKIALQQGNSQPLNVVKFVFANIPGLVPTDPVNLAQGMPAAGNIVFQKAKSAQGYVASDQVVYSIILTPDEGNFTFNWVGLVDADNVLIAVSYTPTQNKYKTVGLNVGNTLTRNFLLQFNNAQATTGINVAAQTWQIDFTGWLSSVDETIRADMRDVFGESRFIGNGMQIAINAGVVSAKAGVGYVGGYRAVLAADTVVNAGALPKDIYIDCMLDGGLSGSNVISTLRASAPGAPLVNFTDGNNKKHYVVKIASISITSVVTDLRKTLPNNSALIDYLLDQIAFKAPISSPVFTDIPTAPTAAPGTKTKQISTTEFVDACVTAAINALVAAAPGALDTLKELATALGNDPNFATTMTNLIGTKAPISSPVFTDIPRAPTAAPGTNTTQLANTAFVQALFNTLAAVARTGSAADLTGTLAAGRLPFSYGSAMTGGLVAQRDANGHLLVPDVPLNESGAKAANTNFVISCVNAAISALVAAAPGALNTLNELAAALDNNPNFATTMTNLIGTKAPISSPIFTDIPRAPTAAPGTNSTQIANTAFIQVALAAFAVSTVFTGTPSAPTAAIGHKSSQIATTDFVNNYLSNAVVKWSGVVAGATGVNISAFGFGLYLIKNSYFGMSFLMGYFGQSTYTYETIGPTYGWHRIGINAAGLVTVDVVNGSPGAGGVPSITEIRKIGG